MAKRLSGKRKVDIGLYMVFSTTGGMAIEASQFLKHLAEKISLKKGQRYSDVMSFVRRRLRFDLLRTCIISIRGGYHCPFCPFCLCLFSVFFVQDSVLGTKWTILETKGTKGTKILDK